MLITFTSNVGTLMHHVDKTLFIDLVIFSIMKCRTKNLQKWYRISEKHKTESNHRMNICDSVNWMLTEWPGNVTESVTFQLHFSHISVAWMAEIHPVNDFKRSNSDVVIYWADQIMHSKQIWIVHSLQIIALL